eukprot:2852831-Pyramimonas_sp.AAC.1
MLDVSSGSGHLSRSFRLCFRGIAACFELDIIHDAGADALNRRVQQLIRGWVRGGMILGVWIATPCQSMSIARMRPKGPPPLRNAQHPLGFPHLSPSDAPKVSRGNCLARFSSGLFSLCRSLRIPVVLENRPRRGFGASQGPSPWPVPRTFGTLTWTSVPSGRPGENALGFAFATST